MAGMVSSDFDADINLDALEELLDMKKKEVIDTIYHSVLENTPIKTGRLYASTYRDYEEGVVGQSAPYASYVESRGKSAGYFTGAIDKVMSEIEKLWTEG